jgi:hypothetical protein
MAQREGIVKGKQMKRFLKSFASRYFENDTDAFNPEWWANEALVQLEENLVAANLVWRDWIKEFVGGVGEVVNISKPGTFTANRMPLRGSVVVQDVAGTKIQVKLDQHYETTFLLSDWEMQKSHHDLIRLHISPAMRSVAEAIDALCVGTYAQFFENTIGQLGTSLTKAAVIAGERKANDQLLPVTERYLVLNTKGKEDILNIAEFSKANEWGSTERQKSASLGELEGFLMTMTQTMPNTEDATNSINSSGPGAINNAAGYQKGDSTFVVDGYTGDPTVGEWVVIAGNDAPQQITAETGDAPTTGITVYPPLERDIVDDAVITTYDHCKINEAAGYAEGYDQALTIDDITGLLVPGMAVSVGVGTAAVLYSIIAVSGTPNTTGILLDRPLEAAIADDAVLGIFPRGSYNLMFHPYGISLVTRPLDVTQPGRGVDQAVVDYNGLGLRVSISYDSDKLANKVTIDVLAGIKVVDTDYGVLFLN